MATNQHAIALRPVTAIERQEMTREQIDLIKATVCPHGIGDNEFALFIEQCRRSGLDPLIKQAFCVKRNMKVKDNNGERWVAKYEFQPAEAGMLARADEFPDYRGTTAGAVYEKDQCVLNQGEGTVSHSANPCQHRGKLLGAWGRVEREGRRPVVVWVDYDSYSDSNNPMWAKKGATMIAKCARVAALRAAYPAKFGGLYIEEEDRRDVPGETPEPPKSRSEQLLGHLRETSPEVAAAMEAHMPTAPEPVALDADEEPITEADPDDVRIGTRRAEALEAILRDAFGAKADAAISRILRNEGVDTLAEISLDAAADAEAKASRRIDERAARE